MENFQLLKTKIQNHFWPEIDAIHTTVILKNIHTAPSRMLVIWPWNCQIYDLDVCLPVPLRRSTNDEVIRVNGLNCHFDSVPDHQNKYIMVI